MTKIMPNDPSKAHILTNQMPSRQPEMASPKDVSSHQTPAPGGEDKAEISTRAHEMVDLRRMVDAGRDVMHQLPEMRAEKIAEARQKLSEGFYRSTEVREQVAGKLADMFLDHPLF